MAIVDCDTVSVEHTTDFLDNVCSARFDTIPLFEGVGMIRLGPGKVEDIWVALEGIKVDTLDKQIRLGALLGHQDHLLDIRVVAN